MVEKISEFRRQMEDGTVLVFVPKKAESAVKDSEGQTITMTYATKAEFQPVKIAADNAVRKDVIDSQTMTGALIVGGHDLSKAVTTDEANQIIVTTLRFHSSGNNQNGDGINHRWTNQDITTKPSSAVGSYGGIHADKNGELIRRDYFVNRSNYVTHRTTYYAHDGIGKNIDINVADDGTFHFILPNTPISYAENEVPTMAYLKYTGQNAIDVGQNLLHTDGVEVANGQKTFNNNAIGIMDVPMNFVATTSSENVGWRRIAEIDYVGSSNICMEIEVIGSGNNRYAKVFLNAYITTSACVSYVYGYGNNGASINTRMVNDIALVRMVEGTSSKVYLMVRNERYENWLAKLIYFGATQGRYDNVSTRARKVVGTVEPEPTTDTYSWVSKPTKMTVI